MKALSLTQPWASALFCRLPDGQLLKYIETRSWRTNFTGRIAVHASKGFPPYAREFAEQEGQFALEDLPLGAIIGTITVTGTRRTEDIVGQIHTIERLYGDYSPGRWAWFLCGPVLLPDPIPCRGALGLWTVPAEVERLMP